MKWALLGALAGTLSPAVAYAEPAAETTSASSTATPVALGSTLPSAAPHFARQSLLGVSLASLQGREADARGDAWALMLAASSHLLGTRGSLSGRMDQYAAVGAGDRGLAGELNLDWALGYRLAVAPDQGPTLRAGLNIWSAWFGWFALDVPQVELGYDVQTRDFWFDAGARGALTIGFASLVQDGPRGAWATRPAAGAYLRTGSHGVELSFDGKLMRRDADRSDLPFAVIQADLCSAQGIALCTRFMHMAAQAHHSDGSAREQTWNALELVVGVGNHDGR